MGFDYVVTPGLMLVGILIVWLTVHRIRSLSNRNCHTWRIIVERIILSYPSGQSHSFLRACLRSSEQQPEKRQVDHLNPPCAAWCVCVSEWGFPSIRLGHSVHGANLAHTHARV